MRIEALDGFSNFTNIKDNLKKELNNVTKHIQFKFHDQSELLSKFQNENNQIQLKYSNLAGELHKLKSKFKSDID